MLDDAFEPFSSDAIQCRKYVPSALMALAEIAFGSDSEEDREEAMQSLWPRLVHYSQLADIGLFAAPPAERGKRKTVPVRELLEVAQIAFNKDIVHGEDLRTDAQAMLRNAFTEMMPWIERGLAVQARAAGRLH